MYIRRDLPVYDTDDLKYFYRIVNDIVGDYELLGFSVRPREGAFEGTAGDRDFQECRDRQA